MVGMEAKVQQSDERLGSDRAPQEAWGHRDGGREECQLSEDTA